MEAPLDDKARIIERLPITGFQRRLVNGAPRLWRAHFYEELQKSIENAENETEATKLALARLATLIRLMTMEMANLALFTADMLIFAVVAHSFSVAAILAVAAGLLGLMVTRGQYAPHPRNVGELFVGSLVAITLFFVTYWLGFSIAPTSGTEPLQARWLLLGLCGLMLPGLGFYFPNWNPKKFTRQYLAFLWAYTLNCVWMLMWVGLQKKMNPQFPVAGINDLLMLAPIMFVTFAMYLNSKKEGLKTVQLDDSRGVSILGSAARIHAIKRQRSLLYAFTGTVGELVVFGALVLQFYALWFLTPNFDPMQAGFNLAASAMLVGVWGYIRRANRRADAMLKKELDILEAAAAAALRPKPVEPIQPAKKDDDPASGGLSSTS